VEVPTARSAALEAAVQGRADRFRTAAAEDLETLGGTPGVLELDGPAGVAFVVRAEAVVDLGEVGLHAAAAWQGLAVRGDRLRRGAIQLGEHQLAALGQRRVQRRR
jgi:hypothetical protein